ncbi:hypothetical protein C8F04DRAFT_1260743 [Mycena alexandri]|uniref:Uncharacterized protein n=1 Tax=Mycena alexandri TaxID=1745969 RepID=A0AAD6X225_9AGAR|nr:hypothetical protein C8F04DRAFT_1260743 [Mycena alexandri]
MSTTNTINHLVSFLARPLMKSHTPATIVAVQVSLHTTFSSSPSSFKLLLSANCPAPTAIQRACIVSGVRWAEWIYLLSSGLDLQLFIAATSLDVELGTMPRRSLWVAPENPETVVPAVTMRSAALVPAGRPFAARLRATLATERIRRGAAINPTRIPTLLSSCALPEDDPATDSESESDSDSDSDISDSGSSLTSTSSATSVSNASYIFVASTPAKVDTKPKVVTRYMYRGGVTQVMSGGVMLSAAPTPKSPVSLLPLPKSRLTSTSSPFSNARPSGMRQAGTTARKTGVLAADSWRKCT